MTLLEVCEPLFQLLCRLNRSARKGAELHASSVAAEARRAIAEVRQRAADEAGLGAQFLRVEPAFLAAFDEAMGPGGFRTIGGGSALGAADAGEAFFRDLSADLADPGEAATERLAVRYTLLGLGFTGPMRGQPDNLRRVMVEVSARLRHMMDSDRKTRIAPEAYDAVNTADLVQTPGRSVVGLLVALVAALLVVLAGNAYFYQSASGSLRGALDDIRERAPGAGSAGGAVGSGGRGGGGGAGGGGVTGGGGGRGAGGSGVR